MPPEVQLYYWDADVFLSYVNETPGRVDEIATLLGEARRKEIQIVTSVASIVEVAFTASSQVGRPLSDEEERAIAQLWVPGSPITVVEIDELTARGARALVVDGRAKGGRSLTPVDAMHLAAAQRLEVDLFHTYDRQLHLLSERLGFRIEVPLARQPQLPT